MMLKVKLDILLKSSKILIFFSTKEPTKMVSKYFFLKWWFIVSDFLLFQTIFHFELFFRLQALLKEPM